MLQTLFYIPSHLPGGTPLFGFGLLLAVWAAFCVIFFCWLTWRQGLNADTWSYVPIFLLVAAVIVWLLPAISKERGLPIHGYGVMVLAAVLCGAALAAYRAKRVGVSPDLVYTAIFWMVVPGIVGARLFYVTEYWFKEYVPVYEAAGLKSLIWAVLNISEGGLVVYGGFFGSMIGLFVFVRKYRVPLLAILDLMTPSLMLGLALGRVGCLLNGCCFGGVCHHGPAMYFPASTPPAEMVQAEHRDDVDLLRIPAYDSQVERGQFYGFAVSGNENVAPRIVSVDKDSLAEKKGLKKGQLIQKLDNVAVANAGQAHQMLSVIFYGKIPLKIKLAEGETVTLPALDPLPARSLPVYPTQLYSTIDAAIICLLLLAYAPFCRRDGELFALLASIYPVTRFLIEILRNDEAAIRGTGMTISQNVSLLILLCTACLWYYLSKQPKGFAFGKKSD